MQGMSCRHWNHKLPFINMAALEARMGEPLPMPRNGPSNFPPQLRRMRHLRAISGRGFHVSVPNESQPSSNLMDLFFTLHEDLQQAEALPVPFYCSETLKHTTNPEWASFNTRRSGMAPHNMPISSFVIAVWDCSVVPIRTVLKLRVLLSELMYLSTLDIELPPNSLLFHMFDGVYVSKDVRFELEGRAIIVRYESFADSVDDVPSTLAAQGSQSHQPRQSMTRSTLLDLIRKKKEIDRLQEESAKLKQTISSQMEMSDQMSSLNRLIISKRDVVERLSQELAAKKESLQRDKDELVQRQSVLLPEARLLQKAEVALLASIASTEQQRLQLDTRQIRLHEAQFFIREHCARLIAQLREVYPVEKRDDGTHTINGIVLPNSTFINCDEETIAAALGHVCHVIQLLSRYLGVPLRYPMRPMQTRSSIEDPISNVGRYPLYSKNQDLTQFEYAVFLLNKNLEQLIHSEGLEIESLRPTLPNLKLLLDSFKPKLDIRPRCSSGSSTTTPGLTGTM